MNNNHYVLVTPEWRRPKSKYDDLEAIKQRARDQYRDLKEHYDWWLRKRLDGSCKIAAETCVEEESFCGQISSESTPSQCSSSPMGNRLSRLPLPVSSGSPIPEYIMTRNVIGSERSCDERSSGPTPCGAERNEQPINQNSTTSKIPKPSRQSRRHRRRKFRAKNV